MTRREFVALIRAQRRHMNTLVSDALKSAIGSDRSEYTKASVDALALMVRVLEECSPPYDLDKLLTALLHLYPGDALCEALRALPQYEAIQDRDLDRDYERFELVVDGVCVAPLIAPFGIYMKREQAIHMVRQLQAQIESGFMLTPTYWAPTGVFEFKPPTDEEHEECLKIAAGIRRHDRRALFEEGREVLE